MIGPPLLPCLAPAERYYCRSFLAKVAIAFTMCPEFDGLDRWTFQLECFDGLIATLRLEVGCSGINASGVR